MNYKLGCWGIDILWVKIYIICGIFSNSDINLWSKDYILFGIFYIFLECKLIWVFVFFRYNCIMDGFRSGNRFSF